MGTHITILEALVISLTLIVLYVFVKTLIQHWRDEISSN
jgi:hypothetical protein